jgi:hypothetical protein
MDTVQKTLTSNDGTMIAYEQSGTGPVVILVASSLADRADTKRLAAVLAAEFTVINYDRRGRGLSGDTPPYQVEREIDDIAALINSAGASGLDITKLALYEPPFRVDGSGPLPPNDLDQEVARLIEAGHRSESEALRDACHRCAVRTSHADAVVARGVVEAHSHGSYDPVRHRDHG